jgi:NAD(P)-dependent dehydrogenase (short-subunit alcohol dehydrogenase family)
MNLPLPPKKPTIHKISKLNNTFPFTFFASSIKDEMNSALPHITPTFNHNPLTSPLIPQLGPPTILINNAGTVSGAPLLSLHPSQIQRTLTTNLHSHFHTLQTFLPSLLASPQGGTIVTISSVLGKLGAANLTDYAAAKAGLIAMHNSLRAELASGGCGMPEGRRNIRTVLVTPGQLGTGLFAGVETPSSFLGPVVEAVELAAEIVRVVDAGESGEVSLPLYTGWVWVLEGLPGSLKRVVRWASGVDGAMGGFVGGGGKRD